MEFARIAWEMMKMKMMIWNEEIGIAWTNDSH
jgi:hypothetical protein